jgi:hypothetical protein
MRAKAEHSSRRLWLWLVSAAFLFFMALVVYRSFYVAGYRCETCIEFRGSSACRTVEGPTEREAHAGAINNTCAQLSSGVTDTMACERTVPLKLECAPLD